MIKSDLNKDLIEKTKTRLKEIQNQIDSETNDVKRGLLFEIKATQEKLLSDLEHIDSPDWKKQQKAKLSKLALYENTRTLIFRLSVLVMCLAILALYKSFYP